MALTSKLIPVLTALALAGPAAAEIEILDAYARSSNPQAGAAFVILENTGDTADRLVSVASDAAVRVELHTHIEDENGVMRMTHVEDGYDLPAGGQIVMKRGADHIMFMGLTEPFVDGQMVSVTLQFEDAGDITIDIPVDLDR